MRVLLTGATGCAGSAIVRRLLSEGWDVHALVRDPEAVRSQATHDVEQTHGAAELVQAGVRLFQGDLGDPRTIADAAHGCSLVVHAAGSSDVRGSEQALGWLNVAGTRNVLAAARYAGCRRLVHVSCADVTLHNGDRQSWNEDRALTEVPAFAHARTKLEAEEWVIGLGDATMETVVLRPALLWGPGDRRCLPRLYEEGRHSGKLRCVSKGRRQIATTHVDNLAEAVHCAAQNQAAIGGVYYIVDSEIILVRDWLEAYATLLGLDGVTPGMGYHPAYLAAWARERRGLPGWWRADVILRGRSSSFDGRRAREELGYRALISRREGFEALASWLTTVGGPSAVTLRLPETDKDVAQQIRNAMAKAS